MSQIRRRLLLLALLPALMLIPIHFAAATISISPSPAYVSDANGHVATGGAWADLNQDGAVNAADLAVLLGAWGACPAV